MMSTDNTNLNETFNDLLKTTKPSLNLAPSFKSQYRPRYPNRKSTKGAFGFNKKFKT